MPDFLPDAHAFLFPYSNVCFYLARDARIKKMPSGLRKPSHRNFQQNDIRRPATSAGTSIGEKDSGKHRRAAPTGFALAGKNSSASRSVLGNKAAGNKFANLMKTRPSTAFGHASKDTSAATAAAAKAAAKTVASFRRKESAKISDRRQVKKNKMPTQSSKYNGPPPGTSRCTLQYCWVHVVHVLFQVLSSRQPMNE